MNSSPNASATFTKGVKLWNEFKNSVTDTLSQSTNEDRKLILECDDSRTRFYRRSLFPAVSQVLNLDLLEREYLRVDFVFYQRGRINKGDWQIPTVFIESENKYDDNVIQTEIPKLCSLNAPLKVLFLWTDWHEKKLAEITEGDFDYFIKSFVNEHNLTGVLGIIVVDRVWVKDELMVRMHSFAYGEDGNIFDDESKLVEVKVEI